MRLWSQLVIQADLYDRLEISKIGTVFIIRTMQPRTEKRMLNETKLLAVEY